MNNNDELIRYYKDKYPAFGSYMECMSRAFMTGVTSFTFSFGGCYFAQHLLAKHLPHGIKGSVAIASFVGVAVSYQVTSVRTKVCQEAWMAGEDKHTFLNPIEDRKLSENRDI